MRFSPLTLDYVSRQVGCGILKGFYKIQMSTSVEGEFVPAPAGKRRRTSQSELGLYASACPCADLEKIGQKILELRESSR